MIDINVNFYFQRYDAVNYAVMLHSHKCYELVYYFSGKGHCLIEQKKYEYADGNIVIIPPENIHNDVHAENCNLLCIGYSISDDNIALPAGVFFDNNDKIKNYLKIINEEFNDRKLDFVNVVNTLLYNILIEIKRQVNLEAAKNHPYKNVLEHAINYINEYFMTDIAPEQLSAITNYSYHRFRHIFKSAFGVSPNQYVMNKRFEYAKKLLATKENTVTEIGYQCGFSSTSLFIKQFKKNTGLTPAKYRIQLRSHNIFSDKQSVYKNPAK